MSIRNAWLVIAFLGLSVVSLKAQDQSKTIRIGVLMSGSEASSGMFLEGLRQGLTEQGLIEGKSVRLEVRYAGGQIDQLDSLAVELATSGVDLIFTGGDQGAWAAKRASDKIPIVAVTCDALEAGLVTNLPRPGGNLTGVTCINSDLSGKRVELINASIPSLSHLGVILNPSDKRMTSELREVESAGKASSIDVKPLAVVSPEDLGPAFSKATIDGMSAVVVVFDAMTFFHRTKLAEIAIRNHVGTIFNFRQYVDAGGLMSYGPNLRDMYRQSARHIQKILKGEAPGELPMEQPTRFEFVINLKTAKALGITIPAALLARADEVIE
jgi:putative tryptophan/tyrosine transport system substrate-binding protein